MSHAETSHLVCHVHIQVPSQTDSQQEETVAAHQVRTQIGHTQWEEEQEDSGPAPGENSDAAYRLNVLNKTSLLRWPWCES